MRRALAVLAVLSLIVVGAWAYTRPAATPTGTPIPYGSPAVGGSVTVRGAPASPGADFRYIVTGQGTGTTYWIVLLDLGAKSAKTVAQVDVVVLPRGDRQLGLRSRALSRTADPVRHRGENGVRPVGGTK